MKHKERRFEKMVGGSGRRCAACIRDGPTGRPFEPFVIPPADIITQLKQEIEKASVCLDCGHVEHKQNTRCKHCKYDPNQELYIYDCTCKLLKKHPGLPILKRWLAREEEIKQTMLLMAEKELKEEYEKGFEAGKKAKELDFSGITISPTIKELKEKEGLGK